MKLCAVKNCGRKVYTRQSRCGHHLYLRRRGTDVKYRKQTVSGFLVYLYNRMRRRVTDGSNTMRPDLYVGKPIMPKDVFYLWAKNNPDFSRLYKRWATTGFDRKLTPTLNRINSSKGYTLDNVEWMTVSQNCSLAGSERSRKAKKAVYNLLGVTNV